MSGTSQADERLIQRGFWARALHALIFELIAIVLTSIFLVLAMHQSLVSMGVLSVIISLTATAWNGVFNFIFDHAQKRYGFSRTKQIRILHAVGFEGGLIFFTVPIAALYLGISFWQAFLLEGALLLFFLPYSVIYNYCYDWVYLRLSGKTKTQSVS